MADDKIIAPAPTSTATSPITEPEVVAGISSSEPRDVLSAPPRWRAEPLALLGVAIALGFTFGLLLGRDQL